MSNTDDAALLNAAPEGSSIQTWYGIYSAMSDEQGGHIIVKTPTGDEVTVTSISRDAEGRGIDWPDKMCVGEVLSKIVRASAKWKQKVQERQRQRREWI